MDESAALKATIQSLVVSRSSLDWWLSLWTWLVVLGVAFEFITLVREYLDQRKAWRISRAQSAIPFPEQPSRPWFLFDFLGILLVVAGVAGELVMESRISKNETDLQDANSRLVLLLEKEAGVAGDSAKNALTTAGHADIASERAETESANALGKAGTAETASRYALNEANTAQTTASGVGLHAAQIGQTLQTDEERAHELEKAIAPRELWNIEYVDGSSTTDGLRASAGTKAIIRWVPDFEAERAARFVCAALQKNGWEVVSFYPETRQNMIFDGVEIEPSLGYDEEAEKKAGKTAHTWAEMEAASRIMDASRTAARALAQYLVDNKWYAHTRAIGDGVPLGGIRVDVGFRSNPYFLPKEMKEGLSRTSNMTDAKDFLFPQETLRTAQWKSVTQILPCERQPAAPSDKAE